MIKDVGWIPLPRLNTGLVYVAGYADKIRRTVFAQLKEYAKDKEAARMIAFHVGQLNRALFTLLVEEMKLAKDDGVKIIIDYQWDENRKTITWAWNTLQLVVYRKMSEEEVRKHLESFIPRAQELASGLVKFSLEKIGETIDGDVIYAVKAGGREVGALSAYIIDENTLVMKKAAVVEPTPVIFEKVTINYAGRTVEEALIEELSKVMQRGVHTSSEEALRIVNLLREKVKAKPLEGYGEAEIS